MDIHKSMGHLPTKKRQQDRLLSVVDEGKGYVVINEPFMGYDK